MSILGGAPQRYDRRVLHEQKHVVLDLAGDACARDVALKRERVSVRLQAEVGDEKLAH